MTPKQAPSSANWPVRRSAFVHCIINPSPEGWGGKSVGLKAPRERQEELNNPAAMVHLCPRVVSAFTPVAR